MKHRTSFNLSDESRIMLDEIRRAAGLSTLSETVEMLARVEAERRSITIPAKPKPKPKPRR